MNYKEIIQKLDNLDLKKCSDIDIRNYLKELGKFGVVITILRKGEKIIRARLSEKETFKTVSELSYKPEKFNKTYQRASTPFKTMFYGSILPERISTTEPQSARITVAFEISDFLRDTSSFGEKDIVFSAWEVKKDIKLISLVHHKQFNRPSKFSADLQANFEKQLDTMQNLKAKTIEISKFLGNQFAKFPIKGHTDYMISAIYSHLITEKYDGVLYPSVRLEGEGINVAIKPETVDNNLHFIGASECTIYKNKLKIFMSCKTQSVIDNDKINFIPKHMEYWMTKEYGRKHVGLPKTNDNNS